jgi:iron complex outermembrane receptor protein/hemoglobin/transferrin/lactoferrin receptor protein
MKRIFLLLILIWAAVPGRGQTLTGVVSDALLNHPLENAVVSLPGTPLTTLTDGSGRFTFRQVAPGTYGLRVGLLGYVTREVAVTVGQEDDAPLLVALSQTTIQLNYGAVVTAQRFEAELFNRPEAVSVVGFRELRQRVPRTVPEALTGATGVFLQKTNHGGGSPFVRGLTGQQTLLLTDGIRINNATFRSGPNQYLNTFDPLGISQIEVVRGSGSVQYGSDALGGAVQLLTRTPQLGEHFRAGGSAVVKYMSADMERTGRAETELSNRHFALLGGIAWRDFGDIKAGGDLGYLRPTGYTQLSGDLKARLRLSQHLQLMAAWQHLTQDSVPLYHRVRLENYQYAHFDPQQRQLGYLRL